MKKVLFILLILSFAAFATTPTVTVTEKEKSGVWAFSFSFTTSAIGTGDTAIVAPSAGYFTVDEWNRTDPVIYYLSTGETTVDSVRFDIVWQGKSYVSETNWHTLETVTADSSLTWTDVFAQGTYGHFPFYRVLILSGDAKTSVQTLTGGIVFKKDEEK